MNSVFDLIRNLRIALGCIGELLGYLLRFVSVFLRSRTSLAARLSAGHVQAEDRSEAASQAAGFRLRGDAMCRPVDCVHEVGVC